MNCHEFVKFLKSLEGKRSYRQRLTWGKKFIGDLFIIINLPIKPGMIGIIPG